jgi:transcriptional regulator with XRE-family HTH domain
MPVSHDVFRERVNLVLSRSGLSYAAFARKAGLDRSTLSQLLTGPMPRLPRAETLAAIAKTARVSVDWLLGLSQREEMGAEIIEAVMQFEPYRNSPAHDPFLAWLKDAQGSRICTVPMAVPDILKSDDVMRQEFPLAFETRGPTPVEAVRQRLEWLAQPHQQLEVAAPQEAFAQFADGFGRWSGLGADSRRSALAHMIGLADELYPSLRIYLYDAASSYSVPFTVFGARRVAMFLGSSYLVLNSAAHIEMFAARFDALVRAAVVQPHQFGGHLGELARRIR